MGLRRKIVSTVITLVQVLILAITISVWHGGANAKADSTFNITGTVTSPGGSGVANVSVYATDPGGQTVSFGPVMTAIDGTYDLPIAITGTYDIHFDPPSGSGLNPVIDSNVVVLGDQVINIQFTPVNHTFSGTLTDSTGNPLRGIDVILSAAPWNGDNAAGRGTTDVAGHFSVTAAAGTYYLTINNNGAYYSTRFELTQSSRGVDLSAGNIVQDLQLKTANLHVTVKDGNGNVVPGVPVTGVTGSLATPMSLYPGDPGEQSGGSIVNTGTTGSDGSVSFSALVGSTYSAATNYPGICATISGAQVCLASSLTVTGDTDITISQPTIHTFSGVLTDTANNPLRGIDVILSATPWNGGNAAGHGATDSTGHFAVTAVAGTYYLTIVNNGAYYSTRFGLSQNSPGVDLTAGDLVRNLQLKTANLRVTVKDGNGNALSGVSVTGVTGSLASPMLLYPGDPGEQSGGSIVNMGTTGSDGSINFSALIGSVYSANTDYPGICATISGAQVCLASSLTVTGDTDITLSQPTVRTFSGTLTDSMGNPLRGLDIILSAGRWNGGNAAGRSVTDSAGHFSVTAAAGTYYLTINNNGAYYSTRFELSQDSSAGINLTTGDLTQDLQLKTANLRVVVKDGSGNVLAGVPVTGVTGSLATPMVLYTGDPGEQSGGSIVNTGTTGSDGSVSFSALVGSTYSANTNYPGICATISGAQVCLTTPLTVSGDATVLLQQVPPAPSAPTALTIPSPTQQPALSWTASGGAASYNIYRDGANVDSSTSATYVDSSAPVGTHTYYVTAVNAGGESGPSNSVSVFVGTQPAITSANSLNVSTGKSFNLTVTTTGVPTPTLTETGSLPAGVTFTDNGDGTATLSGTPNNSSAGIYDLTFTAENGIGNPATQAFTLTVTSSDTPPAITSASTTTVSLNVPFSFTVTASGKPAPTITRSGTLPTGVTFTDNGNGTATISGTPTGATGTYTLALTATNSVGSSTQTFSLVVSSAPTIKKISNKNARVGKSFSMTVTTQSSPTATITQTGALPAGLTFIDNGNGTATISGTPQTGSQGTYMVTVTATNSSNSSTSQTFSISVR